MNGDPIVANPNCSAMQLTCVLKPLEDAAGLARVRLATYQSMSGKGDAGIEKQKALDPLRPTSAMDWDLDGEEFSEEWKLRAETPEDPRATRSAAARRPAFGFPVLVGHAQAVWVETKEPLSPDEAAEASTPLLTSMLADLPTPLRSAGRDEVLVGRIRRDTTEPNGLALWIVNDNLRKGAALNAVQIAELLLARQLSV